MKTEKEWRIDAYDCEGLTILAYNVITLYQHCIDKSECDNYNMIKNMINIIGEKYYGKHEYNN